MIDFFNKVTEGLEEGTLDVDLSKYSPEQYKSILNWAHMVMNDRQGLFNVDVLVAASYIKRAVKFLQEATELLMPYTDDGGISVRTKVFAESEVPKDFNIPRLHLPIFAVAAKEINNVDLYNRGLKSFMGLGVLRTVVESG